MWNWNKAIVALVSGLLIPGITGPEAWIVQLWDIPAGAQAAIVAMLTWLVPNSRPVWEMWK